MKTQIRWSRPTEIFVALMLLGLALEPAQAQFTFVTNSGSITITEYTGNASIVSVPDTINNLPVSNIGDGAFEGQMFNLWSVTIPEGVTNIGPYAFAYCYNLWTISLPNSLISIGTEAFRDDNGMGSIAIPTNVVTIGDEAFDGMALRNANIPASVTNLGAGPFRACYWLTNITVDAANPSYTNDATGDLLDKTGTTLIQYPCGIYGSFVMPDTITTIGDRAFADSELENLTIGMNVTNLGIAPFSYCFQLTNITVNPANPTYASDAYGAVLSKDFTTIVQFPCGGGGTYVAPPSVTTIAGGAFLNSAVRQVILGENVLSIGASAFAGCADLNNISFLGNAPSVGDSAFQYVSATIYYYYLPGTTGWTNTLAGRPTVPLYLPKPLVLNNSSSLSVQSNEFGFIVSWATNAPVVVDVSTNLANPDWRPLQTNTPVNGVINFHDAQRTNSPGAFYRVRAQ